MKKLLNGVGWMVLIAVFGVICIVTLMMLNVFTIAATALFMYVGLPVVLLCWVWFGVKAVVKGEVTVTGKKLLLIVSGLAFVAACAIGLESMDTSGDFVGESLWRKILYYVLMGTIAAGFLFGLLVLPMFCGVRFIIQGIRNCISDRATIRSGEFKGSTGSWLIVKGLVIVLFVGYMWAWHLVSPILHSTFTNVRHLLKL